MRGLVTGHSAHALGSSRAGAPRALACAPCRAFWCAHGIRACALGACEVRAQHTCLHTPCMCPDVRCPHAHAGSAHVPARAVLRGERIAHGPAHLVHAAAHVRASIRACAHGACEARAQHMRQHTVHAPWLSRACTLTRGRRTSFVSPRYCTVSCPAMAEAFAFDADSS
eukprot:13859278-Alexandrium_andersonii.AAC.1